MTGRRPSAQHLYDAGQLLAFLVERLHAAEKIRFQITRDVHEATDIVGHLLGEGVHQVGDWTVDVSRSGRYWVVLTSNEVTG